MIFSYWQDLMAMPADYVAHTGSPPVGGTPFYLEDGSYVIDEGEDLHWYDGYNAGFWYLLNVEWYRMNDKQFARTGSKLPYEEIRDFDESYVNEFYP